MKKNISKIIGIILGILLLGGVGTIGTYAETIYDPTDEIINEQPTEEETEAEGEEEEEETTTEIVKVTKTIKYKTKTKYDKTKRAGTKVVKQKGKNGKKVVTYEVTKNGQGEEIGRRVVKTKVTKKARNKIVVIGTKKVKSTAKKKVAVTSTGARRGAICRDGWRSYATGRGACSHHGGVSYWLYK